MKKLTILFLASFLTVLSLSAQVHSFGIKGGYLYSNLASSESSLRENNVKSGFSIGFIDQVNFGALGLESELLYARKGAKYELPASNSKVNVNLNYLEMPINLKLRILRSPLSIYGGGYAGILLGSNYTFENQDGKEIGEFKDNNGFNVWDLGVQTGAQIQLSNLIFDLRYSRGLKDIDFRYSPIESKNYNIQLTMGFLLHNYYK